MKRHFLLAGLAFALLGTMVACGGRQRRGERRDDVRDARTEALTGWNKLGERWINHGGDHDTITVGGSEGRFTQIQLVAEHSALELYDPYPLGTVFAATFWDVREASDDPARTARLLLDAVEDWDPDPASLHGRDLLAAAVDVSGVVRVALCASIGARFPDDYWPAACELQAGGPR